jgi:putative tryptophan/tyrosine transport system ATP-binding protein
MLQIQNINKSFPQMTTPALKNINLQFESGEYCVILGSNGSGKSTLLKIISGEYKTDAGKIILAGKNISKKLVHERAGLISCVAQDVTKGTIQEMTLLENIALSIMRGKNARFKFFKNDSGKIVERVKLLGLNLERYLDSNMANLSGGQRQAIATLMAVSPAPNLLLLDEHTSALDPRSKEKIMSFTDNFIKEHKITSLMITHNIDDAIKYGDRLIIMHHGEVAFDAKGEKKQKLTSKDLLNTLHQIGGSL